MLLPIKPVCEAKNIRRDGTSFIFIQYCYSSRNRPQLNTQITIPLRYWNKNKLAVNETMPPEFGCAETLNKNLQRYYG